MKNTVDRLARSLEKASDIAHQLKFCQVELGFIEQTFDLSAQEGKRFIITAVVKECTSQGFQPWLALCERIRKNTRRLLDFDLSRKPDNVREL